MKILSYKTWILLALFISLFLRFGLLTARAEVKDLGDVCFTLDYGVIGAPVFPVPLQVQVGLLLYGAEHIALHGELRNGSMPIMPIHGTAVKDGNNFVVTMNTSKVSTADNPSTDFFSVIHMVVNVVTLQGTFTAMSTPPPAVFTFPVRGYVRFLPCN